MLTLAELLPEKKAHVRWSEDELDQLAEAAHSRRCQYPEHHILEIVRDCQKCLPPDRRREIRNSHEISAILRRIRGKDKQFKESLHELSVENAQLRDTCDGLRRNSPESILREIGDDEIVRRFGSRILHLMSPADIAAVFEPNELVWAFHAEQLAALAHQRLFEEILDANRPVSPITIPTIVISGEKRVIRPKLLIVGLQPEQAPRIRTVFERRADLLFINSDKLSSIAIPNADRIVLQTKFLNKNVRGTIFQKSDPKKIIQNFGGTTSLVRRVEDLLLELEASRP
ncbi:MAG TPA: hypothetical protein VFE46_06195 [Pirellulales bacterium]|jgi:hypothetical protein|nr:hypothetical protein [Pirellulales bacterium]